MDMVIFTILYEMFQQKCFSEEFQRKQTTIIFSEIYIFPEHLNL